jgi:SHS2 domain-containing protein
MKTYGFQIFPTTADLGVEFWGESYEEFFSQGGVALTSIITDVNGLTPNCEVEFYVKADSLEDLVVAWLNELIYLMETHRVFFSSFQFSKCSKRELRGVAKGEPYLPEKHTLGEEVKAATYHNLEVTCIEGYRAKVILDL